MPRDGSGHSDNAVEADHDIIYGAGKATSDHVDRADKTAPMPVQEQGAGIPGMNAAAGTSGGIKEGSDVGQGGRGEK